jgi:hypothetical protein
VAVLRRHSPGFRQTYRAWALLALLLPGLAACSEPEPRKPTFVGQMEGARPRVNVPEGLNPLGSLETCQPAAAPRTLGERVLVSRPEQFTREASLMLSELRQALAEERTDAPAVQFLLSAKPIATAEGARSEGRHCGALVVLWEPFGTRTLEMTLPDPARIPLRASLHPRLCEFGNYQEQMDILYLTIMGLLAMLDNRHDRAVAFLEQAKRLDSRCLRLRGDS